MQCEPGSAHRAVNITEQGFVEVEPIEADAWDYDDRFLKKASGVLKNGVFSAPSVDLDEVSVIDKIVQLMRVDRLF